MALSRSEFDGGNWSVGQPNNTVDPKWAEVVAQKSSCNGQVTTGPVTNHRATRDEDIRQIPYTSICGEDWFTVEVHAKAGGGDEAYPAISIFDRNHKLIVQFDSELNEKTGAGFVESRGEVVRSGKYNAYYKAELADGSNKTAPVFIGLTTHGKKLGDVTIEAGDTHANVLPTATRLEDRKRLADHARLEVPRHQSVDILRGPSVGHAN